jgi:hypothetical protein
LFHRRGGTMTLSEIMKSKLYSRFDRHGYKKGVFWKEIEEYYKLQDKDKLFCNYCGKELVEIDAPPYRNVVSVDRIIPDCEGGTNDFSNLAITCAECNIVKGTMSLETFMQMVACLEGCGIKDKVFKQIYRGRRAAMFERKVKNLLELV